MKCILMNKNIEVFVLEYDEVVKVFNRIIEIKNIDYAPYQLKKIYEKIDLDCNSLRTNLNEWFKRRKIPAWRDQVDLLLHRLNINTTVELLDKAFGLSLTDQYWIKPYDYDIKYEDINFFDHDFDYSEFLVASLSINSKTIKKEESLKTPNNTTDGMLKKAWVIENGKRYLLKGGYKNEVLQPFNEVLASWICERLGFNHVTYTLDNYKNMIVSKCECFINKDTELITAHQIMNCEEKYDTEKDYEKYIELLEKNGISNARIKVENMYILDYLIMNEDRHLNNFGIIRYVNTLKWLDIAPIFDNGQSLNISDYNDEEIIISGKGRLFYQVIPFDNMIKVVKNLTRINISSLNGIVEKFDELLHQYQNITHMSDRRINRICFLLNNQINKLNKLIKES